MPAAAREYVSMRGLGNADGCRLVLGEVAAALHGVNPEGAPKRASFAARVLLTVENIEDEWLNPQKVLAATGGVLPCLWVNITYDPDHLTRQEVESLEVAFDLRLTGTAESAVSYF